jgi:hypothetical protein
MALNLDDQARAAYETFSKYRRGYRKMPPWDLTLESDRHAWREVATAVLDTMQDLVPKRPACKLAFLR